MFEHNQNFHEKSLQQFKQNVRERVSRGGQLCFDEMINFIREELTNQGIDPSSWNNYLCHEWYQKIIHLEFLHPWIEDPDINEIIYHGQGIFQLEIQGALITKQLDCFNEEDLTLSLEILCLKNHISWNFATPFQSFSLSIYQHPVRLTLLHPHLGPYTQLKFFLRKISAQVRNLESFCTDAHLPSFLNTLIKENRNLMISGSTGCGKTSLLSSLISLTPAHEHLIILEDTHEIKTSHPHTTYLLAEEGRMEKNLSQFCAYCLRLRPDRIILGEMRSREIIPFLLLMNNGHKGLMSTIHAQNSLTTIPRMALLFELFSGKNISYESILKLICRNVEYVIHLRDKKITEISRILGCEGDQPFMEKVF